MCACVRACACMHGVCVHVCVCVVCVWCVCCVCVVCVVCGVCVCVCVHVCMCMYASVHGWKRSREFGTIPTLYFDGYATPPDAHRTWKFSALDLP